jgi:hypothetical protein
MANAVRTCYLAECFWAGVRETDLRDLDQRIEAAVLATSGHSEPVRYLGWLLVTDDDVVLVFFEGPMGTVRRVAEHAEVPFERFLLAVRAPRRPGNSRDEELLG